MPQDILNYTKLLAITGAVTVVLTAGGIYGGDAYLYQTPYTINAAIVSHKFKKLKNNEEFSKLKGFTNVERFMLDHTAKLVAHPKRENGQITGYDYECIQGSACRTSIWNILPQSWPEKPSSEREQLKEEWKNEGALQDWEAVDQFIKDFEKAHHTDQGNI